MSRSATLEFLSRMLIRLGVSFDVLEVSKLNIDV